MARSPMTPHTLLVLRALASSPGREMYGFEIMRAASLPSGTVYPLLARLEAAGWVTSREEKIVTQEEGRPARRYFQVTPAGVAAVREAEEREAARLAALGVETAAPEPPVSLGLAYGVSRSADHACSHGRPDRAGSSRMGGAAT